MSDECLTKLCSICNGRIAGVSWYCPECKVCICFICGVYKAELKCPKCGKKLK